MAESYSDPFLIYDNAIKAGMPFITLTDHNSIEGCLRLRERYGDRVITGVESTVYFPEDGCKVHLLLYGISEQEFGEIQKLRRDIYELRSYIRERHLAHSVAHATYSVQDRRLTLDHLEKLIVLFDTFEAINGARHKADNLAWRNILENLTPGCLDDLARKHALEPFGGGTPWIKGLTGGSDDHAGIFIGRTYTEADAGSADEFVDAIRQRRTSPGGRHSDYQSLAFSIYKITYDFSRQQGSASGSLVSQLTERLFEGKRIGFSNRVRIRRMRMRARRSESEIYRSLYGLVENLKTQEFESPDDAIRFVDERIVGISDEFLRLLFTSVQQDLAKIDLIKLVQNVSAAMPGIFLSIPFFLTLHHLTDSRALVSRLESKFGIDREAEGCRILWFTDTLNDLNGVAVTLREIGWLAHGKGQDLKIVACLADTELNDDIPPNVLNLPSIYRFKLPYYAPYVLKVPSILSSLREIYSFEPDKIYISTPGPIGALGLMVAKLMNIKSIGFYHTDFALQAKEIVDDESVARMLDSYTRWFYSSMDEIRVPSREYIEVLAGRGFDRKQMQVFRRGIDLDIFKPRAHENAFSEGFGIKGPLTLLYVGRISQDKGLDFLLDTFRKIAQRRSHVRLLVVGNGPYLAELKARAQGSENIVFAGRLRHEELPRIYTEGDILLFPSATDTFGKVVLEAQACGLPVIVSDVGGPKEIIRDGKTGFVAKAGDPADWEAKIEYVLHLMETNPIMYQKIRGDARNHAAENFTWDTAFGSIFDGSRPRTAGLTKMIA